MQQFPVIQSSLFVSFNFIFELIPSKHEALAHGWFTVGPTVNQRLAFDRLPGHYGTRSMTNYCTGLKTASNAANH